MPKSESRKRFTFDRSGNYRIRVQGFLDATEKALEMGNPILGNIMMIGAAAGIGALPLDREDFEAVISETFSSDKLELNLKAFEMGVSMVQ
jgi:indolepyruvate ferredoxin oxidoreductase beta subunit